MPVVVPYNPTWEESYKPPTDGEYNAPGMRWTVFLGLGNCCENSFLGVVNSLIGDVEAE
jgi:hypothetical protein